MALPAWVHSMCVTEQRPGRWSLDVNCEWFHCPSALGSRGHFLLLSGILEPTWYRPIALPTAISSLHYFFPAASDPFSSAQNRQFQSPRLTHTLLYLRSTQYCFTRTLTPSKPLSGQEASVTQSTPTARLGWVSNIDHWSALGS